MGTASAAFAPGLRRRMAALALYARALQKEIAAAAPRTAFALLPRPWFGIPVLDAAFRALLTRPAHAPPRFSIPPARPRIAPFKAFAAIPARVPA